VDSRSPRNELVAYVRSTQPTIRVVFRGNPRLNGSYIIGATGTLSEIQAQPVTIAFDPTSGHSQPIDFRFANSLPDQIGIHSARFDWYLRDLTTPNIDVVLGTSKHAICTSWRAMIPNPNQDLESWVYKLLMEWTCQWCQNQNDEKDICDAIIRNLHSSGLRYGIPQVWEVREMLQRGGGMCGGWYQMFQQMAHCQGVFVHRRRFLVHWRSRPNNEILWCAIVIRNGGLNQQPPTDGPSEFHDNETEFPITTPIILKTQFERRYRFWGTPIIIPDVWYGDGHCINFLEYQGRLYLYDSCFQIGPIEIDFPLPPETITIIGGLELASFKSRYLNKAVDYMLGSLYNGNDFYQTIAPSQNGMTVKTACIPDIIQGEAGISFYWGG
jgi:hypothetical protein